MKCPRVMPMGVVVVLAGTLVSGGALAQPTPPAGNAQSAAMGPGPMGPGMMPHGAMPHGQMPHGLMHGPMMPGGAPAATGVPTLPGQDAFGAIAELVRLLDADPQTDWSQVDLERLRQHLIDMNDVVLRADPQYAGFILIMLGFLLQWPTVLTLAMFPILATMYVRLAHREEREARAEFGEAYARYAATTPTFVPRFRRETPRPA